ncbi:hypothetical protein QYF36_016915 [Acer negundo]|nr:hypothetical protein QYF36_016915 [Acer negundo]
MEKREIARERRSASSDGHRLSRFDGGRDFRFNLRFKRHRDFLNRHQNVQFRASNDIGDYSRVNRVPRTSNGPSYAEVVKFPSKEPKLIGVKEVERNDILYWDADSNNSSWLNEDTGSSSFEDSEVGLFLKYPTKIEETSNIGLDHNKGGSIVIDLGIGLGQDSGGPNQIINKEQLEAQLDGVSATH